MFVPKGIRPEGVNKKEGNEIWHRKKNYARGEGVFTPRDLRSAEQSATGSPIIVAKKIYAAMLEGKTICNEAIMWLQTNFEALKNASKDLLVWIYSVTGIKPVRG